MHAANNTVSLLLIFSDWKSVIFCIFLSLLCSIIRAVTRNSGRVVFERRGEKGGRGGRRGEKFKSRIPFLWKLLAAKSGCQWQQGAVLKAKQINTLQDEDKISQRNWDLKYYPHSSLIIPSLVLAKLKMCLNLDDQHAEWKLAVESRTNECKSSKLLVSAGPYHHYHHYQPNKKLTFARWIFGKMHLLFLFWCRASYFDPSDPNKTVPKVPFL